MRLGFQGLESKCKDFRVCSTESYSCFKFFHVCSLTLFLCQVFWVVYQAYEMSA